jgi:two-component system, sensor histidine kinase ChiS
MEDKTNIKPKIILIVEDDEISFLLIQEIINSINLKAVRAVSRNEVMDLIDKKKDYGVIVMDVRLYDSENGYQIARELSEMQVNIPVMIVSAYANEFEQLDKRNLNNVKEVMFKPFSIAHFKELLLKTLNVDKE